MIEFRDAIRDALAEEIERDPAVVFFGYPATPSVKDAVAAIHAHLVADRAVEAWPAL